LKPETAGWPPDPLSRKDMAGGASQQEKQLSEGKTVTLRFLPQNYSPHCSVVLPIKDLCSVAVFTLWRNSLTWYCSLSDSADVSKLRSANCAWNTVLLLLVEILELSLAFECCVRKLASSNLLTA